MRRPRRNHLLDLQHDDKFVRDELCAHVLGNLERLCRRKAEQPRKREQHDAEDELERERCMQQPEQDIDALE